MNPNRLFFAGCVSLVASAFSFVIRQDILPGLAATFTLDAEHLGKIAGAAFAGQAISMAVGSVIVDSIGMKAMLMIAALSQVLGTIATIGSPQFATQQISGLSVYDVLWYGMFLSGCGNGLIEIGINPLIATLYPTEKTHKLNVLHAWFPGGLVLGGLLMIALSGALGIDLNGKGSSDAATTFGWQVKSAMLLIPTVVYGALFLIQRFPVTERVASGISHREMYMQALRPMFLLWAFCMLLTASTELGPQSMQSLVLGKTAGMSGTVIVIYTNMLAFVLRHFAGPVAHRLSPIGMMTVSAVLATLGLLGLSYAYDRATAVGAATIFGIGYAFFWPTMLGVTAERFPRGGAFLLGVMGCVANLAIFAILPQMGKVNDHITIQSLSDSVKSKVVITKTVDGREFPVIDDKKVEALPQGEQDLVLEAQKEGAKWSFRYVAILPFILVFIFGGIAYRDHLQGGYKPEVLTAKDKPLDDLSSEL
jgi:MFS family permease